MVSYCAVVFIVLCVFFLSFELFECFMSFGNRNIRNNKKLPEKAAKAKYACEIIAILTL